MALEAPRAQKVWGELTWAAYLPSRLWTWQIPRLSGIFQSPWGLRPRKGSRNLSRDLKKLRKLKVGRPELIFIFQKCCLSELYGVIVRNYKVIFYPTNYHIWQKIVLIYLSTPWLHIRLMTVLKKHWLELDQGDSIPVSRVAGVNHLSLPALKWE